MSKYDPAFLKDLRTSVQERKFNPDKLSPDAIREVDSLFRAGAVADFNSIDEYIAERGLAKRERALEYAEQAEPGRTAIREATGLDVSRPGLEFGGEVIGATSAYLYNRKNLSEAYKRTKLNPVKVDFINSSKNLGQVLDSTKLKGKKGLIQSALSILPRTANFLKRTSNIFVGRDYSSTAKRVGVYSALAGASGAAAGSVTYDVMNMQKDFATNATLDIGKISENELLKLPTSQRMEIAAINAFKNSLLWTGGTSAAITGALRLGSFGAKVLTGTTGKEAKTLALSARKLMGNEGIPLILLANNKNTFGAIIRGFFTAGGLIPGVGSVGENAKRKLIEQGMAKFTSELSQTYGMLSHNEIFGHTLGPVLKNNYIKNMKLIDQKFGQTEQAARLVDPENNFAIVPTNNLRTAINSFSDTMNSNTLKTIKAALDDPDGVKFIDPNIVKALPNKKTLLSLTDFLKGGSMLPPRMTLNEYQGFITMLNNVIKQSGKNDDLLLYTKGMRMAMESDLNTVAKKKFRKDFVKTAADNPKIKQNLDAIDNGDVVEMAGTKFMKKNDTMLGPPLPNTFVGEASAVKKAYLNHVMGGIDNFGKSLTTSNDFMSRMLQPYERTVARKLAGKTDKNLFSTYNMLDIVGEGITPDQVFKHLSRDVLQSGSKGVIQDFKILLGTNNIKGKLGREYFQRLKTNHIFDAFFQSFENSGILAGQLSVNPAKVFDEASAKRLFSKKTFKDGIEDATEKNVINPYDLNAEAILKDKKFLEIDKRKVIADVEKLGDFNADKFIKNLKLDSKEGVESFIEMIADGTSKAEYKMAQNYVENKVIPFIASMKNISDMRIGSVSSMIARQTQLGGARGFLFAGPMVGALAGSTLAATGLLEALTIPLMLRGIGYLLTRPKLATKLLDAYLPEELIAKKFKTDALGTPTTFKATAAEGLPSKRRALGAIINLINDETQDSLQINLDKLSDKEIQEKQIEIRDAILGAPTVLPDDTFSPEILPDEERKRMYPEYEAFAKASNEDKAAYLQYVSGLQKGKLRAELAMEAEDITEDEMLMAIQGRPAQRQPAAPEPVQEQQMAQNQPIQLQSGANPINTQGLNLDAFGSLFPDDPMGQLIADRKKSIGGPNFG